MVTLNKVTAFVTRGDGYARELLVCRHPEVGGQLPAGTVEPGETIQTAALRHVAEATGLTDLAVRSLLAALEHPLLPGQRVLLRAVDFRAGPEAGALPLGFTLPRGSGVNLLETCADFARVSYDEYQYNRQSGEYVVTAQQEGWIPTDALTSQVMHYLFHLQPVGATPDRWAVQVGEHEVEIHWVSLLEDPELISSQDVWLGCVFDQLRA